MKKAIQDQIVYGSFFIGDIEIALNVESVQEVVNFPDSISQMPMSPDYLKGVFNLRGLAIPIIDLGKILRVAGQRQDTNNCKIAILNVGGCRTGLLLDKTGEVLRPKNEEIAQYENSLNSRGVQIISGLLKLDGGERIIQVLNPAAIVKFENIPQDHNNNKAESKQIKNLNNDTKKCITFAVRSTKMAINIEDVHEILTVPEIKYSPFESDLCLGMMTVRGHIIPVIRFSSLLQINNTEENGTTADLERKIMILKLNSNFFGLMVDKVDSINSYQESQVMSLPVTNLNQKILKGCVTLPSLGDVSLINVHVILSHEEVAQIAQGHSKIYGSSQVAAFDKKKRFSQREVYISFRLSQLYGVPIKDVKEIIEFSEQLVAAPGTPPYIKGLLNLRGTIVTVVDMRRLYQLEPSNQNLPDSKIIIFQRGQDLYGFIVDSVDGILNLDSESKLPLPHIFAAGVRTKLGPEIKEVVQLKEKGDSRNNAMVILNVDTLISRIVEFQVA